MKFIILSLLLACAIASTTYADESFTTSWSHRQRPNGLMITGIFVAATGGFVAGVGSFAFFYLNDTNPEGNPGLYALGAGVVIIAGGIALIVAGKTKQTNPRLGVISPKRNEFGFAYHFK